MIDVKELRVGNVLYVKYESKTHIVHSIHEYKTFNGGYAIRMEMVLNAVWITQSLFHLRKNCF